MSDHTKTPWYVSSAICGEHQTETVSIYHEPNSYTIVEVVEAGCKCDDEALTEANARHIVHCVNNHERLVEALRESVNDMRSVAKKVGPLHAWWDSIFDREALLATLEAEKRG